MSANPPSTAAALAEARGYDPWFLGNPERRVRRRLAQQIEPPPPIDYNRWAEDHLIVAEGPMKGPYNPNRFPFFREVLDDLSPESLARVITLLGSAQIGKTLVALIFVAASLDLDPGAFMYVHPTEHNGIRFARTKWRPMLKATPRLGEIFTLKQSKEGGNSTLFQERKDGLGQLLISGASSEASLSMLSMKRIVEDDLSKWENNTAGDPEAQADSRAKAYRDAKILKCGTALLEANCRTTKSFKAGSQKHYHVPCPHCRHLQPLDPHNFIATINPDAPEDAGFTCVECGCAIEESHRAWMVDPENGAKWVAHNPAAIDPSYTLWAAYAPLESWERIARAYIAALGDPKSEQTWWNDTGGQAYELPGEAPDWEVLKERGEKSGRKLGQIPIGALLTTLGLDCQDDYVDGCLYGWGPNLWRCVIARIRVEGHISTPECRAELNRLVDFEWPTASGDMRKVDLVGIDANAWTDEVFDWANGHPKSRVIMCRGVGGDATPVMTLVKRERRRDGRLVKYQGRFFNVGVSGLKGGFYKFLRVENPEARGFVDIPEGLADDWFEQLTSEKRTPKIDQNGFTFYAWVKPRGARNEQLDCAVMAEALARKIGWRVINEAGWDKLRDKRERPSVNSLGRPRYSANEFWGEERTPESVRPPPAPKPPTPRTPSPNVVQAAPWAVTRPNFRRRY